MYSNWALLLTSCHCIYVDVQYKGIDQVENEFIAKFFQDIADDVFLQLFLVTPMAMEGTFYISILHRGMFIQVLT